MAGQGPTEGNDHSAEATSYRAPCRPHTSRGGVRGCHAGAGGLGTAFPFMMVGLAATICLLFVSFGVLLCCYYKLLTSLDRREDGALPSTSQQAAAAAAAPAPSDINGFPALDSVSRNDNKGPAINEIVVIMAGRSIPTFLAFPTTSPSTLFPSDQQYASSTEKNTAACLFTAFHSRHATVA